MHNKAEYSYKYRNPSGPKSVRVPSRVEASSVERSRRVCLFVCAATGRTEPNPPVARCRPHSRPPLRVRTVASPPQPDPPAPRLARARPPPPAETIRRRDSGRRPGAVAPPVRRLSRNGRPAARRHGKGREPQQNHNGLRQTTTTPEHGPAPMVGEGPNRSGGLSRRDGRRAALRGRSGFGREEGGPATASTAHGDRLRRVRSTETRVDL
jgi:hypothetical protein